MGLVAAVSDVFSLFSRFFGCLPVAIRLLIIGVFGLAVFFGFLSSLQR